MVVLTYRLRAEPGVTAIYEFLAAKILNHLFFERLQGLLARSCCRGNRENASGMPSPSVKSPICIIGLGRCSLLFPYFLSPSSCSISKIVVCTVIIQDLVVALCDEAAVFVDFRLNEVALLGEYRQRSVDIMHFICGAIPETGSLFCRTNACCPAPVSGHISGRTISRLGRIYTNDVF